MNGPELALSGSNPTGDVPFSAALRHEGRTVSAASPAGQRGDLATLVDGLCRELHVAPDAIRRVVVDVGPGSYTGLRVAVTFVRFLQHFGTVEVLAVDSLALLAARASVAGMAPRPVRALLDARRGRVHTQSFVVDAATIRAEGPAVAVPMTEVAAALAPGELVVVPALLPAPLTDALRAAGAELLPVERVTAEAMLRAGLPRVAATSAELEPRYLMGSYAED